MQTSLPPALFVLSAAARTAIVVLALIILVRVLGRRDVGEMNLIDLITILLVGNAVQNAMTYGSGSLAVGLASALVLLLLDRWIGALINRLPRLENLMFGDPVIIYADGVKDRAAMEREGVEDDELMTAVREQGLSSLEQVHLAVLEENGEISIIPKDT